MKDTSIISTNPDWTSAQVSLIQSQIAPGCSLEELQLFGQVCRRTGLDPFSRQIYAVSRGTGDRRKMTIQVSIDGFRLQAERSKHYGGSETFWCGDDGVWRDVWLSKESPAAAKTVVYKRGCEHPFSAVALWTEYKQEVPEWGANRQKTGRMVLADMWRKMPATMLAKCSEALALRKAFPAELAGLYSSEEMMQADSTEGQHPTPTVPQPPPQSQSEPAKKLPRSGLTPEDCIAYIKKLAKEAGVADTLVNEAFHRRLAKTGKPQLPDTHWINFPPSILRGAANERGWLTLTAIISEIQEEGGVKDDGDEEPELDEREESNLFGND